MSIPKHNELRKPVLEFLKAHGAAGSKEMVGPLSKSLGLTDEEVERMYPSGNGPMFKDRISWALTYLALTDLVARPRRAIYEITPKGISMLSAGPAEIDAYIDEQMAVREVGKAENSDVKVVEVKPTPQEKLTPQEKKTSQEESTPLEKLDLSYAKIRKSVLDEILDTIISKSPKAFEHLVVALLKEMGYGGEIENSGTVTQASNDHGIDGIIKEDVLGFGRIHVQAKKYNRDSVIGREDIQKFVGALAVAQSNRGVFITTSYYSKGALEYVKNLYGRTNIILIDGNELAGYIYDYNVGMQTEKTITIKKLDSDFWDLMEDKK